MYERILRIEPSRLLGRQKVKLNDLCNTANSAVRNVFVKKELQLTVAENKLAALNPKSVLRRGYSITTNKKTSEVVTSSADVEIGDLLITELAKKNLIESRVQRK